MCGRRPVGRPTSGRLEVDEQEMLFYQCQSRTGGAAMDLRLELVSVPVADVDRAKAFYVDQVGFGVEQDVRVDENHRFVELMPPGSPVLDRLDHELYRLLAGLPQRSPAQRRERR